MATRRTLDCSKLGNAEANSQMPVPAHMAIQSTSRPWNIRAALQRVGLSMQDVVRTRMFVTDISRFAEAARAHHEFFAEAPPASTMVEVKGLVHPAMLIEIEADAYRGSAPAPKALERTKRKITGKKKSAPKLKRRR